METVPGGKPKLLLNLSNFRSTNWTESQKNGWTEIIDIGFPTINREIKTIEALQKNYLEYYDEKRIGLISTLRREQAKFPSHECYLYIMGEQSVQYLLTVEINDNYPDIHFAFPVIWKKKDSGTGNISHVFIRWRIT